MHTFQISDLNRRSRESGNPAIQPGPWVPALRCAETVLGPAEGWTRGAGTTRMTLKAFRIYGHAVAHRRRRHRARAWRYPALPAGPTRRCRRHGPASPSRRSRRRRSRPRRRYSSSGWRSSRISLLSIRAPSLGGARGDDRSPSAVLVKIRKYRADKRKQMEDFSSGRDTPDEQQILNQGGMHHPEYPHFHQIRPF